MITLSSDFGWAYPAAMRGVIAARSDARMIDISHEFPRGDIRAAGFWLRELLPWFPPAVHLVVIDPGVGTERAVLALDAGDHVLVGPDNGVLIPVARTLDPDFDAYELETIDAASDTFHGRDVFAPLAAEIHGRAPQGLDTFSAVSSTDEWVDLSLPEPDIANDSAVGEIVVLDSFGNAITNVPGSFVQNDFGAEITVNGEPVSVERTYGAVDSGDRLVTVGSHGNVELAVRDGRGAAGFDVDVESAVRFSKRA